MRVHIHVLLHAVATKLPGGTPLRVFFCCYKGHNHPPFRPMRSMEQDWSKVSLDLFILFILQLRLSGLDRLGQNLILSSTSLGSCLNIKGSRTSLVAFALFLFGPGVSNNFDFSIQIYPILITTLQCHQAGLLVT